MKVNLFIAFHAALVIDKIVEKSRVEELTQSIHRLYKKIRFQFLYLHTDIVTPPASFEERLAKRKMEMGRHIRKNQTISH